MSAAQTVFVVDDDPAVREGLQWLLEADGLRVATYESAEAFLADYDPAAPGCLVLDMRMRGMDGLALQARLAEMSQRLPVIMLTAHGDIALAVRAVKAGAVDFLEKPVGDQVLLDGVHKALRLDQRLRAADADQQRTRERLARLTPREREVLELILVGRSSKQIAANLDITEKTVEAHRGSIMQKMEVHSAVELARIVTELRLPRPDERPGAAS